MSADVNEPALEDVEIEPRFQKLLALVAQNGGSDLHFKPNVVPRIRYKGSLRPVNGWVPTAQEVHRMVLSSMPPQAKRQFADTWESDYAIVLPGIGRFRANAYKTRGETAFVGRILANEPLPLAALGVPEKINDISLAPNGLILVTGATGSGKSTTLAGMVDLINKEKPYHILTIEDPIEILHHDQKSTISQRELYTDTKSFPTALRAALREDPDVILVGELRDAETAKVALHAAETGHLVMSTLHTNSAADTINRLIKMFPAEEQEQTRITLAEVLRGVICQRLVLTEHKKRIPVVEIMSNEGRIAEGILDPDKYDLYEIIEKDNAYGMQTFEQHLLELVRDRIITPDVALRSTNHAHDLRVKLKHVFY